MKHSPHIFFNKSIGYCNFVTYFPPIICDVYVGYDMRVFQIKCSLTSSSGIFQTLTIGNLQLLFSQPLFHALEQVCLGEFYHNISLTRLHIVCTCMYVCMYVCMYYHTEQFNVIWLPSLISKQGVYLSTETLNWLTLSGLRRLKPLLALWCPMPTNISTGKKIRLSHGCVNVDLILKTLT